MKAKIGQHSKSKSSPFLLNVLYGGWLWVKGESAQRARGAGEGGGEEDEHEIQDSAAAGVHGGGGEQREEHKSDVFEQHFGALHRVGAKGGTEERGAVAGEVRAKILTFLNGICWTIIYSTRRCKEEEAKGSERGGGGMH